MEMLYPTHMYHRPKIKSDLTVSFWYSGDRLGLECCICYSQNYFLRVKMQYINQKRKRKENWLKVGQFKLRKKKNKVSHFGKVLKKNLNYKAKYICVSLCVHMQQKVLLWSSGDFGRHVFPVCWGRVSCFCCWDAHFRTFLMLPLPISQQKSWNYSYMTLYVLGFELYCQFYVVCTFAH